MARKRNTGVSPPTVGLAVFIAVLVGFFIGRASGPQTEETKPSPEAVQVADAAPAAAKKIKLDPAPAKGPKDAPVVIYEISEFQ